MNEITIINHDEIAKLAYQNWEKDGRPNGRDRNYWLEAEQQLKATKHLLLMGENAARAAALRSNGNGKLSANGNGESAGMKPKTRKSAARPALARSI